MWISTAVVVILIPLVTSLVKDADPKRVERWGIAKSILLRIFSTSTTRSSQTGESKVSVPVLQSAVHPDDRKKK
jgi:hypothetical protein